MIVYCQAFSFNFLLFYSVFLCGSTEEGGCLDVNDRQRKGRVSRKAMRCCLEHEDWPFIKWILHRITHTHSSVFCNHNVFCLLLWVSEEIIVRSVQLLSRTLVFKMARLTLIFSGCALRLLKPELSCDPDKKYHTKYQFIKSCQTGRALLNFTLFGDIIKGLYWNPIAVAVYFKCYSFSICPSMCVCVCVRCACKVCMHSSTGDLLNTVSPFKHQVSVP